MPILEPTSENIERAVEALRLNELVVIPTETVYGLAAVATNREAIAKVFQAKGRPANNPLIVHLSGVSLLSTVAAYVPDTALRLAEAFWPGPLTLVLPKSDIIPDEVTAGGNTVAVRVPRHPVALELLTRLGAPLAAPSANQYMSLSPTRAEHVAHSIAIRAAMILDGGPCGVGLESTVVDCTEDPAILRLGQIGAAELSSALGKEVTTRDGKGRSPGQHLRHYAPRARLILAQDSGDRPGLTFRTPTSGQIQMPSDPEEYGSRLYASLYELDLLNLDEIAVEEPPKTAAWAAIWDRLIRASNQEL